MEHAIQKADNPWPAILEKWSVSCQHLHPKVQNTNPNTNISRTWYSQISANKKMDGLSKKKKTNKPEEKSTCYWETPDNEKMGSLSLQLKKNLSEIFVRCPLNLSLISAWQTSHSLAIDWTSTLSLPATELHIRSSNISPWTTAAEAPSSLGSPDHIMELIRGQSLLCPLPASSHPSCPARTPCTLSITDLHSPHPLSTHCWGISAP